MNDYTCPACKRKVEELQPIVIEAGEERLEILRCDECKEAGLQMQKEKLGNSLHN
jgi:hypothetical protein